MVSDEPTVIWKAESISCKKKSIEKTLNQNKKQTKTKQKTNQTNIQPIKNTNKNNNNNNQAYLNIIMIIFANLTYFYKGIK